MAYSLTSVHVHRIHGVKERRHGAAETGRVGVVVQLGAGVAADREDVHVCADAAVSKLAGRSPLRAYGRRRRGDVVELAHLASAAPEHRRFDGSRLRRGGVVAVHPSFLRAAGDQLRYRGRGRVPVQ
eukprot:6797310-Prymnesium_polylepis.1